MIKIAINCCKMLQIAKDSYISLRISTYCYRCLKIPRNFYRLLLFATDCHRLRQIATDFYKLRLYGMSCILVFIDPIRLCLKSIQLIGMRLFFYIKEVRVDLLNKTLKMAIFQSKMAQKWRLMAKIPNFFYWSNKTMP